MATDGSKIGFVSNLDEVLRNMDSIFDNWLEESAGEIEAGTKALSRVDTGETKNSYSHVVDKTKKEAHIGSNLQNSIWEEFGTGEYAVEGNGRKGGWVYKNPKYGLNGDTREFVFTLGKTPNRPMLRAYKKLEDLIISRIQALLKGDA